MGVDSSYGVSLVLGGGQRNKEQLAGEYVAEPELILLMPALGGHPTWKWGKREGRVKLRETRGGKEGGD